MFRMMNILMSPRGQTHGHRGPGRAGYRRSAGRSAFLVPAIVFGSLAGIIAICTLLNLGGVVFSSALYELGTAACCVMDELYSLPQEMKMLGGVAIGITLGMVIYFNKHWIKEEKPKEEEEKENYDYAGAQSIRNYYD